MDFQIKMWLSSGEFLEEIKETCTKNKCEVTKVTSNPGAVIIEITTADPVNFYMLGRRWLAIDNIMQIR